MSEPNICHSCRVNIIRACEVCIHGEADVGKLRAALAIVDKLDKTDDGVPITPRMMLYSPLWQPAGVVESLTVCVPLHDRFLPLKGWYSTRAAAEAARGE